MTKRCTNCGRDLPDIEVDQPIRCTGCLLWWRLEDDDRLVPAYGRGTHLQARHGEGIVRG